MTSDRKIMRLAAVAAIMALVGLTGCGRKGPLDPPPGAQVRHSPAVSTNPAQPEVLQDSQGNLVAPRGHQRPFMLDWLLN